MSRFLVMLAVASAVGSLSACGGEQAAPSGAGTSAPATETAPNTPTASRPRVVVLGDSLTAGLGIPTDEAYPAVLQQKIDAAGLPYQVVNAGVSGDTSAGGVRRLDWALDGDVRVLILALGANDGLRGLPVDRMKENLETIIERAKARQISIVLAGMEAPPNFGPEYTAAFRGAFRDLAREHDLPFIPFLLERVAGESRLNQGDGIHPNTEGARVIADSVWQTLHPILSEMSSRS